MSKPKTHVAIILDRSGSMSGTRAVTVTGYNEQVEQIQNDAKDQDILVSLITFNGNVYEHFWDETSEKLTKASHEDYNPVGSTALYDAMGYAIDKLQKTTTEDENTSYLIITITDGEENSSKQYNNPEILKKKIESLQKDKNWTFTFMGCGKDSLFRLAAATGASVANCALWSNDNIDNTMAGLVENKKKLGDYFEGRRSGSLKCMNYYSPDNETMADYSCCSLDESSVSADGRVVLSRIKVNAAAPQSFSFTNNVGVALPENISNMASSVFSTTNKEVKVNSYYVV